MHWIGNLGQVLILLPASIGLIGVLAALGFRRDAVAFSIALAACLAATFFSKLAFEACQEGVSTLGIESPSGHASIAATVYGCLAILIAAGRPIWQRVFLYAAAALLVLLVAVSRVFIEVHTEQEAAFGLTTGAACVMLFWLIRGRSERPAARWRAIMLTSPLAIAVALPVLLLGRQWTPEPLIDALAWRISAYFHLCA